MNSIVETIFERARNQRFKWLMTHRPSQEPEEFVMTETEARELCKFNLEFKYAFQPMPDNPPWEMGDRLLGMPVRIA